MAFILIMMELPTVIQPRQAICCTLNFRRTLRSSRTVVQLDTVVRELTFIHSSFPKLLI